MLEKKSIDKCLTCQPVELFKVDYDMIGSFLTSEIWTKAS